MNHLYSLLHQVASTTEKRGNYSTNIWRNFKKTNYFFKLVPPFGEKIKKLNDSYFRAAISSESLSWRNIVQGTMWSKIIIVIDIVINDHHIDLRYKMFDFSQFHFHWFPECLDKGAHTASYSLTAFPRASTANCAVHL